MHFCTTSNFIPVEGIEFDNDCSFSRDMEQMVYTYKGLHCIKGYNAYNAKKLALYALGLGVRLGFRVDL